jgi:hypothetical protein
MSELLIEMGAPASNVYLRTTYFDAQDRPKMTTVASATDLVDDPHVAATAMRYQLGPFAQVEIFEWHGDLKSATKEAKRRAYKVPLEDYNKDVSHDWIIAFLLKTNPGGSIIMKDPSPVQAEDLAQIMAVARQHPAYQDHLVVFKSADEQTVILEKGEISMIPTTEWVSREIELWKKAKREGQKFLDDPFA